MLAEGNSSVVACSHNLLSAMQREIPFARSKGMDPDIYDMPFDEAESYLDESARNVLGVYEDRIDIETVALEFGESDDAGGATYTTAIIQSSMNDESDDYTEGDE